MVLRRRHAGEGLGTDCHVLAPAWRIEAAGRRNGTAVLLSAKRAGVMRERPDRHRQVWITLGTEIAVGSDRCQYRAHRQGRRALRVQAMLARR